MNVRCVGSRLDWLEIAYHAELKATVKAYFEERARVAVEHGSARVDVGALDGALSRPRGDKWIVTNNDMTVVVDRSREAQGWTIVITWRGLSLARRKLTDAIDRAREVARSLADPLAGEGERVRRVDLAGDYAGWAIVKDDCDAWIGKAIRIAGRGSIRDWREGSDVDEGGDPCSRETYHKGLEVTGVVICPGNPLSLRCYDKRAELALPDESHTRKRESEEAIWTSRGWNRAEPVTRVEPQIRGKILREFRVEGTPADDEKSSARDPRMLPRFIDSIWAYVTCGWIRMVTPIEGRRLCRCPLDPRWQVARETVFEHAPSPLVRARHRCGATLATALGAAVSFAASRGHVYPLAIPPEALDSLARTEDAIKLLLQATAFEFADLAAAELVPRGGTDEERHESAIRILCGLVEKRNAAYGRFALDGGARVDPFVPPFWRFEK